MPRLNITSLYDRRAKALGVSTSLTQSVNIVNDAYLSKKFNGDPKKYFWITDPDEHYRRAVETGERCCFNHCIGLPRKGSEEKPMYDYEIEILNALEKEGKKYLWILKATGLGVTEFFLRYVAWLCIRDDKLRGSTICIVTGPRIDLAISLVRRLKALFVNDVTFDDKETICTLMGVRIEAFPSHTLDSMRGLDRVSLILLDEAAYFPRNQQEEARTVSERYIAKSPEVKIIQISTAGNPEGMFASIQKEEYSLYHRMTLDYTRGLGKIYTEEEIAKARESPSFPREYECSWQGVFGNCFSPTSIETAIKQGEQLIQERLSQMHPDIPREAVYDFVNPTFQKSIGVDPGWSSSAFAVTVTQLTPQGLAEVIYSKEFDHADFNDMVLEVKGIYNNYGNVQHIFVDDMNPEWIVKVKQTFPGERLQYQEYLKELKAKGRNWYNYMTVIPVSFRMESREMLAHLKDMLDSELLAINPNHNKILVSLRTAYAEEGMLKKLVGEYDDSLDSLMLSLKQWIAQS